MNSYLRLLLFVQAAFSLPVKEKCPKVRALENFNIFNILGPWYVAQYYSSSEEALTYNCMRAEFGLSQGYMDMILKLTYIYANDPNSESQTGNMTWQIPDPRRPEHWRHTENPYKGAYDTDVLDTDYTSWLILLHCSDPESEKKFLSTSVLSRTAYLDRITTEYLREKIGQYRVPLEYLFPVNQTFCYGEINYPMDAEPPKHKNVQTSTHSPSTSSREPNLEETENNENYADDEGNVNNNNGENDR